MKIYPKIKRLLDLIFSIIGLVTTSLFMAIVAIVIKLETKGPVFYKQQRVGKNAKIFTVYKFRTMRIEETKDGKLLSAMERITKVGFFLRKTSIDEIPQLFNILKGEMSFIGPRPLLVQYLKFYNPEQMRRHEITPGVSGWAQVNGRNTISWKEKFKLDVWYVDHSSFSLDLKILFLTIYNVLTHKNINSSNFDTMPFFTGNPDVPAKTGLIILGAGGHGKVVAEIARLMNKWDDIVFLDDNKDLKKVNGYSVIGGIFSYLKFKEKYTDAFVAIGDNQRRTNLITKLINSGFNVPSIIHPFSYVSSNSLIGEGTVIMAGTVINTNTIIGKGCIINTSSSIDHDCILEDGVHVSPGVHIGGNTSVGKNTWICLGSSVVNNIKIGRNTIVASGAVVTKSIPDNVLVGGVPARKIKDLVYIGIYELFNKNNSFHA